MASSTYEIVVLGATGFTGVYIAEAIAEHLPTDLKWAIAGRSRDKLSKMLSQSIKPVNKDRADPAIETCSMDPADLGALAKKTKVLVNAVGPYHLYSEPVVKACAENGTHYIDCTGEVPWVRKMLMKYDETAKKNGAILVPQAAFESAVSDILVWETVSEIRSALKANATDVVASLHILDTGVISSGTLTTAITLFNSFPLRDIQASFKQWSLAPQPGKARARPSLWTLLTGLRTVTGLGQLTSSVTGDTNGALVHRSASLLSYGTDFRYEELMRPKNAFNGFLAHWGLIWGGFFLLFPPVRWILARLVASYAKTQGPARDQHDKDNVEYRAVGKTDRADGKSVFTTLKNRGNMYKFTGTLLAVGAQVLARQIEGSPAAERKGFCTPAMLGEKYVDGMKKTGMTLEAHVMVS